jgi:hypothetical protein
VVYDDPSFRITPSTGQVLVWGHVADVAGSGHGYSELVVVADAVTVP